MAVVIDQLDVRPEAEPARSAAPAPVAAEASTARLASRMASVIARETARRARLWAD